MKESIFLNKIIKTLTKTDYIGDDCAYIKDLGIVLTQDTLVEDIHFSLAYTDAYKLGYKSVIVNISDILASGADPKYISISLSLPKNINTKFIEDFYRAVEDLSNKFKFTVTGGDITGSEKIVVSICAIGTTKERNISSRKNAKAGDIVIVNGEHGASAFGLEQLKSGLKDSPYIKQHLMPQIDDKLSSQIAQKIRRYAMMDSSDGIADALFKIATNSNVTIKVDYKKIPHDENINKDLVLYGGEDYKLVATISKDDINNISPQLYTIIGEVTEKQDTPLIIEDGENKMHIKNLDKTFNHFGD